MTKEEIQKKGQDKFKAIQIMCEKMQVKVGAKQVVTEGGIIETVVMYQDVEKYQLDTPEVPVVIPPNPDEIPPVRP